MRVLMIEAYTDANIGSGALVSNAVRIVRHYNADAKIRIMAHYPNAFRDIPGAEVVEDVYRYPFGQPRWKQVLWLLRTLFWMSVVTVEPYLPRRMRVLSRIKLGDLLWAQTVISIGAERINEKYPKNVLFSLFTYWIAKKLGRHVIIFPCTIGPLFRKATKCAVRSVLSRLDLVLVRDRQSAELVRELHACSDHSLVQTTDIAIINRSEALRHPATKASLGISEELPIIGISAMRWTYVRNSISTPYSNYGAYVMQMATLADTLVDTYHVAVVFYPTNYPERGCREDDVAVCREIRARMVHANSAIIQEERLPAAEFQARLALSEINIATRMHACILSTGIGVPTLSINYLFKLRGYMESLGLGEFSVDIEEFSCERMLPLFERMWSGRDHWRGHLRLRVALLEKKLWEDLDPINAYI